MAATAAAIAEAWENVNVYNQFNTAVSVGIFKVKEDLICIRNCVQSVIALVSDIVEVPSMQSGALLPTRLNFKHTAEGPGTTFRLYIARSASSLSGLTNEKDSNVLNSWNVRIRFGGATTIGTGNLPDNILDNRLAHRSGGGGLYEKTMRIFRVKNGGSMTKWVRISTSRSNRNKFARVGGGVLAGQKAKTKTKTKTIRKFITPPIAIRPHHVQEFHIPKELGTELFLSWS